MAERHEVIDIDPEHGDIQTDNPERSGAGDGQGISCKLCFEEITQANKFTMDSCGCFFCLSCMKTYVEVLIKDGVVLSITCPDAECVIQGQLHIHEVGILAQPDTFEKYVRLKYEQEVAIDPYRTFCPNVQCACVCHICFQQDKEKKGKKRKEDATSQTQPQQVFCPTCHFTFCHICKAEWTENHKCADFGQTVGSELMKLQARTGLSLGASADAVIKRCPVCNVLIEKDRGCAQMICKNCSHVFCWYCLKLLDNDFMLRHYDNGPCKNFLGHSRAQVFRHRMGVIGLFTAFSILLLIASPIILLAAPIFLCCKWKDCCERALRRAQQENNNALYTQTENNMKMRQSNLDIVSEVGSKEQRNSTEPVFPADSTVHPSADKTEEMTEQTTL